ncbi:MAG TPA: FtsL-like putative cell division protein [Flavobacteriales bacterium]|nr:FtsL-like putative cell division protein [Flavobacteriales bacterium]
MLKGKKKILKVNFFEKGGISNNSTFIFFVVFLMVIQIGISLKSENTIIAIRESEKKIFDLQMKLRSLTIEMDGMYKRSVIESKLLEEDSKLKTSDKLPLIIEQ